MTSESGVVEPAKSIGLRLALQIHKRIVSPVLHAGFSGACRFQPSCSEYAALAVDHYGWWRGGRLALMRFLRCHPGCEGGFDPVPGTYPATDTTDAAALRPGTVPRRHLP